MVIAPPAIATRQGARAREAFATGALASWMTPAIPFMALLALVASSRWIVLASHAGPPGMDPGNWLSFGNALLGHPVRDTAIVYPPLVPLLSVGIVRIFGASTGFHVLATLASIAPGVGLFVLLRSCGLRYLAVAAATVLSASSSVGEAAAWGGYPQLLSLGFLFALLGCARLLLTTAHVRWAVPCALLLLGALASNELMGVAAVVAAALVAVHHVSVRQHAPGWSTRRACAAVAIVVAPSAVLIPTYITLVTAVLGAHQALARTGIGIQALIGAVAFQFRELPVFWFAVVAGAVFTALTFPRLAREPAIAIGWVLLCTTVLLVLATSEPRYLYLLPASALTLTAGLIAAASTRLHVPRLPRAVLAAGAGLVCLTSAAAGLRYFEQQMTFYGPVTASDAEALRWLRDSTPSDTIVAVTRAGADFTLGWWVEGLAERHAFYDADLGNLNYADERARAVVAESIFAPGSTLGAMCARAGTHGITYLFLAKSWPGYRQLDFSSVDRASVDLIRDTNSLLLVRCLPQTRAS